MKVYHEKKLSSYTTFIPSEIKVDPSKWEVALQEIQFPHSWFNIRKGYNKLHKIYYELKSEEKKDMEDSFPNHIRFINPTQAIRVIDFMKMIFRFQNDKESSCDNSNI